EGDQDDDLLFYNPWTNIVSDNNSAVYVALTAEVPTTPLLTVNTFLNGQQKEKAKEILLNNHQIFAENISEEGQTLELGQTKEVCYEINTPGAKPIKQRAYRALLDDLEFLKKEIKEMEKREIIQESNSPWSLPVVIVPKKNRKCQICIDYRKLNAVTTNYVYPLPDINEILSVFEGA
ncbi:6920_t:CDS:1, partial [Racocetra persica]